MDIVKALPRLVPAEEPEAGELLAGVFAREDITVRTGMRAQQVSHDGREFTVSPPEGPSRSAATTICLVLSQ